MRRTASILALLLCAACAQEERYVEIIDVAPAIDPQLAGYDGEPPYDAILESIESFGPVHAMAFYGDHDPAIERRNRELLQFLGTPGTQLEYRVGCSMFHFASADTTDLVGRNYDNVPADVIAAWFFPPDGYASISLIPTNALGFAQDTGFDSANPAHGNLALNAPLTSIEGLNEAGVAITLASLSRRQVRQLPDREPRFLLHFVRDVLDHAGSVAEAIEIAESRNLFDNGRTIMSHHILLAGPGEESVVLEWRDGRMHVVRDAPDRQVVTNSDLFERSNQDRRQDCRRYRTIARSLDDTASLDWRGGLDILSRAAQPGGMYEIEGRSIYVSTEWSAIFDLRGREILLCVDRDYRTVYRMRVPRRDG